MESARFGFLLTLPTNPNPRVGTETLAGSGLRRRSLAAVSTLRHRRNFSIAAAAAPDYDAPALGVRFSGRKALQPDLGVRATAVSEVEFAVDLDSYGKLAEASREDDGIEIAKLGISPEIVSALSKRGITKLFPIQRAVLEPAMQGRDLVGRARTGTGKTLAFGIPIMDKIIKFNVKNRRRKYPLALALAPTRELARQVAKEFQESAPSLDTICVYGGTPIYQHTRQLGYGVDVVVGTPGRIIDLLKRGSLKLSEVQFLVLDEADEMLNVGFQEAVETILEEVPQKRQTMMFSATMPPEIRRITRNYLDNPISIDLVGDSDQKLADGISLYSIASNMRAKASIIGPLIAEHANGGKCIVFTQTKRDASQLSFAMSKSYKCEALHGAISQEQRERTLARFRDGRFNILVATDVAARGLDIPNVDLIIHYELPNNSEIFVHRSGRTGRAGKKGVVILVYTKEKNKSVRMIERDVGTRFTELPPMAGDSSVVMGGDSFSDGSRFGSPRSMNRRSDDGFDFFGGGGGGSGRTGYGGGRSGSGRSSGYGGSSQNRRPGGARSGRYGSSGDRSGSRSGGASRNRSGNSGGSRSNRSGDFDFDFSEFRSSRNSRNSGLEDADWLFGDDS